MTHETNVLSIRTADVSDAVLLAELIRASFEEYRDVLNPPSGAHKETVESIAHKMQLGGAFIAELDGRPAGCVVYELEDDHVYLGRLAVMPDARRHGIASALVRAVEEAAINANLPRIQIGVRLVLEGNHRLFESLGFQFYEHGYHEGHTEPTFMTMRKELAG